MLVSADLQCLLHFCLTRPARDCRFALFVADLHDRRPKKLPLENTRFRTARLEYSYPRIGIRP